MQLQNEPNVYSKAIQPFCLWLSTKYLILMKLHTESEQEQKSSLLCAWADVEELSLDK